MHLLASLGIVALAVKIPVTNKLKHFYNRLLCKELNDNFEPLPKHKQYFLRTFALIVYAQP